MFRAFDGKSGKILWEQKTNSGIMAMPSAYEVDGTEYIAIQSGWGVDAQRIQDSLSKTDMKLDPRRAAGRRHLGVRCPALTTVLTIDFSARLVSSRADFLLRGPVRRIAERDDALCRVCHSFRSQEGKAIEQIGAQRCD